MKKVKRIGVILSGGNGSRFGSNLPKQFAKLAGRCVIEYTIDAFQESSNIDEIIIVSKADYIDLSWDLVNKNQWSKVTKIITGGTDRFMSTYSAILSLESYSAESIVLFHDAVRPLISERIIQECVEKLKSFSAIDVAITSSDTLIEVEDDGCIKSIPSRAAMRRGQTPQGFKLGTIREAYALAREKGRKDFTCDCGVMRAMMPHIKIATVDGSEQNKKITHPIDLWIVEKMLQSRSSSLHLRENNSIANISGKKVLIFGGSSGIGKSIHELFIKHGAIVFSASRSYNGVDISKRDNIDKFLKEIHEKHGSLDVIINTAALLIKKPLDQMDTEEINSIIDTNYMGMINIAIASYQYLKASKGVLLNFTSSSYTRGRAYYSLYSSTKCATVNFTQALAEEWGKDGIRVNCINPERTQTPMRVANFGLENPDLLLQPEEVAEVSLVAAVTDKTGLILDIKKKDSAFVF